MPALIPVHNTLGALFIGTVLSSIIYGVTWLQVYSYYNSHCSRDRWPLKSLLVDTINLVFNIYTTYHVGITNFGDYQSNAFKAWRQLYLPLFLKFLYSRFIVSSGQGFSIHTSSDLRRRTDRIQYWDRLKHIHEPGNRFLASFSSSDDVLCDILITVGMVYHLLSNRTQVRRVFAISCVTLLVEYRDTLINTPSLLITIRLSLCAFMSILNSRDNLRETLDAPEGVVTTLTQLKTVRYPSTKVPGTEVMTAPYVDLYKRQSAPAKNGRNRKDPRHVATIL
ncbi:hypothetical protein BJY52DRAFT_1228104 [Lactarius psammicola]|nr:hypothetical protein BJY52DRAFT_1228104 [Lactarius psammicola]